MRLNFKNRIALHYIVATAIIIAAVFLGIFFMVKNTVYANLDRDLNFEATKHTGEITVTHDSIYFYNKKELEEREHLEIQINPVFLQLSGRDGTLFDKSPNLKENQLGAHPQQKSGQHFNAFLVDQPIRQVQMPIEKDGEIKGYMLAAMSLEASMTVLDKLGSTLLVLYPIVLAGLFLISSFLAGRSIAPIRSIINTTNTITRNNLNERVALPTKKDELHELSAAINELLERIEKAIERERQFTSDASHELRTPLSSLQGTLEVLVRKPRSRQEYEEKIGYALSVIDTMTFTLEQLLLLSRGESPSKINPDTKIDLPTLIDDILFEHKTEIAKKDLKISVKAATTEENAVPEYYAHLILDNAIENAIKYAKQGGTVGISVTQKSGRISCSISDNGIGIKKQDIDKLFNNFYRSDALEHRHIPGNGLGLSIAKKSAEAIGAELSIESELGAGTTFTSVF